jgi:DMSO/TMAO reductase YedYZ heme-binding membrane subunit
LALGVIGFYLMIVLILSSYLRKHISRSVWRGLHSLNGGLYLIVFIHALYMGTDLKDGIIRSVFIYANIFLALLFIINLIIRLRLALRSKIENNENLR